MRAAEAQSAIRRAHNWFLASILGEIVLFLLLGLLTGFSRRRVALDDELAWAVVLAFWVAQLVTLHRLSRALGEPSPWARVASSLVPFAMMGVQFAVHSKAMRRLRGRGLAPSGPIPLYAR